MMNSKYWFCGIILLSIVGVIFISGCVQTPESTSTQPSEMPETTPNQTQPQTPECTPNWQCSEWSECSLSGKQTRTCADKNNCGVTTSKPAESQSCEPLIIEPGPVQLCKNNDYYCPWECNNWKLDNDCGVPEIYDFIEHRVANDYLSSDIIHWDDTKWRNYQPLIQKVSELTNGITDYFERAKIIANWVKNSRPYSDPSPANEGESVVEIFNSETGVCMDAAILTAAMFRIAGIPSRAVFPTFHEYAEGYINGRWIGFDSTFGSGDALVIDPATSILYNNEYCISEPKYVTIFSDGTPRDVVNVSYYKINLIPRNIFRSAEAELIIIWELNTNEEVQEKYCELLSFKTGQSERFDTSPISKTITNEDNEYSLNCKVVFVSDPLTEHNELVKITFTGIQVETESLISSGYVNINVETSDMENILAEWGVIYIPTTSMIIFKNNEESYSLDYDKAKYSDITNIEWTIKADNLNCDYYRCSYTNSSQYSQHISPTGILGYGIIADFGTRGMPPEHYNGFSKIELPEGKYKLTYSMPFAGDVGYTFFEVSPNKEIVIYPNQIIKYPSATQNKFEILKSALLASIEGLNP